MMSDLRSMADNEPQFHVSGEIVDGVHDYFHACDVFVMPGLGGLALQQAMMCAKPVVCSVADGTELDLVKDGRNGFFLPREEPIEAWTQRISRVLTDPDLRERMGRQSGAIIEGEFNSDIMIQRILDAIEYSVTNAG